MNARAQISIDGALHPILQQHRLRSRRTAVQLPLVSVIITNHNYAKYGPQAINSVAHQTYIPIECVIVDDSSSDGSYEAIQAYLCKLNDSRLRALKTPKNIGQFGAIRVGLENSTGPFVCCLDADDILFPEFVEEHVAAHLNGLRSATVSGSDSCQINADGVVLEGTQWFFKKPNVCCRSPEYVMGTPLYPLFPHERNGEASGSKSAEHYDLYYVPAEYHGYHVATGSCLMFRRPFLEMANPPFKEKICADYYYYVLAHGLSGSLIIPKPLTYYRIHGSNNFARAVVLGGENSLPPSLDAINARLHRIMLDKLLECEQQFLVYPRDRYHALIRYLIKKRERWRYGRKFAAVREAYACSSKLLFALNYHPVVRKLPFKKLVGRKRGIRS